jgi:CHAT domain-containing protein
LALETAINFENSVEILLKTESCNLQNIDYLGFAPKYDTESGLVPLKHNVAEVRLAKARFGGKTFEQEAATDKAFYQHCSEANLLHLACHSIIDQHSNEKSYFAFAQNGKIHWFDLYNLRLKAQLAVLSACNTNDGSWATGEGVSSLSSALHYAGCKTMLATRWQVNDAAANQYIGFMFAALSSHKHKRKAHQEAIANYLKTTLQTRKCHPFYWAAFVVYG